MAVTVIATEGIDFPATYAASALSRANDQELQKATARVGDVAHATAPTLTRSLFSVSESQTCDMRCWSKCHCEAFRHCSHYPGIYAGGHFLALSPPFSLFLWVFICLLKKMFVYFPGHCSPSREVMT